MEAPRTKVVVIIYSTYSHTAQLARAVVEGAKSVDGVDVELYQVPETLSPEIIEKMGATATKKAIEDIPVIEPSIRNDVIKSADAVIFGCPTRFGGMTAQMKAFFDQLGGLWFEDACVGKVASAFTGTGTQHGGQETTIFSMITPLLHLGFVYVGLPYSCKDQCGVGEVSGGSPYGASFIADTDGSRQVSEREKKCGRFQGQHVAQVAKDLKLGRLHHKGGASSSSTTTAAAAPAAAEEKKTDKKAGTEEKKKGDKKGDKKAEEKGEKEPSGDEGKKAGKKDKDKEDTADKKNKKGSGAKKTKETKKEDGEKKKGTTKKKKSTKE
ncbi:NAD(P)H dehydrogenase (quinone) [Balamuthia mandrillaris]